MIVNDEQLDDLLDKFSRLKRRIRKEGLRDGGAAHQLYDHVLDVYRNRVVPPPEPGQMRLMMAGLSPFEGASWLSSACSTLTDIELDAADSAYEGDGWMQRQLRRSVLPMLLYADQYAETDPLSIELEHDHGDLFSCLYRLLNKLAALETMRPLLQAGILVELPIAESIDYEDDPGYAAREQVAFHDYMLAAGRSTDERHTDTSPAINSMHEIRRRSLRDVARTAAQGQATLIPNLPEDWDYINYLNDQLRTGGRTAADRSTRRVVAGLASVELPMFAGVPAATLAKVRRTEESFDDWRRTLRTAARTISTECSEAGFADEAREVYEDLLVPMAATVRRATSRSKALGDLTKENSMKFVFGASFGAAGTSLVGLPALGSVVGAVAGGVSSVAAGMIHREKPTGAAAVMSVLLDQ